jgi:hypothetical protein
LYRPRSRLADGCRADAINESFYQRADPIASLKSAGEWTCGSFGYPERLGASVGIPQDALAPILQMLIAERFKSVVLRGSKFRYRSAKLVSFSIQTKLGEDDLSDEAAEACAP